MERYQCKITVGVVLIEEEKILLMKRRNTNFENGMFEFVMGHVEKGESLRAATIREAKEEVGVDLKKDDLKFLTTIHVNSGKDYINFFFTCNKYEGQAKNCEIDNCSEVKWFNIDDLPENLGLMAKRVINAYKNGITLEEYEWEN